MKVCWRIGLPVALVVLSVAVESAETSQCVCNKEGYIVCESKGRIYAGQCVGDNRQGVGVHQLTDGARYEGEFNQGLIEGLGLNVLKDGAELRGEFSGGKLDGYGVYQWPNNQEYSGQWKNGKRSGLGKLTYTSELTFEGEWEDDVMAGMGVLKTQSVEIAGRFHGDDIIDEIDTIPVDLSERLAISIQRAQELASRANDSSEAAQEASDTAWRYATANETEAVLPVPNSKKEPPRSGFGASNDDVESEFSSSWGDEQL
eukprot:FR744269.1.p1 GENE.FR744269.1~~FR744269.1.p1  ORF type:complete len:259 (+),score=21.81 FR744269.1:59-835(+)